LRSHRIVVTLKLWLRKKTSLPSFAVGRKKCYEGAMSPRPKPEQPMTQVGVRIDTTWVEEIDRVAVELSPYKGVTLTRSDALKAIIRRGLDGFAGDQKRGKKR
jgi:hypothetical protein